MAEFDVVGVETSVRIRVVAFLFCFVLFLQDQRVALHLAGDAGRKQGGHVRIVERRL